MGALTTTRYTLNVLKHDQLKSEMSSVEDFINISDIIRNATRRTDQHSGRSQLMGQFRLYRCKGMSGTAALHIVCNQASKMCTRKLAKNQVGVKL